MVAMVYEVGFLSALGLVLPLKVGEPKRPHPSLLPSVL
jgi:hypothetical protein